MLGWFNEGKVKKLFNIPRQKRISLIITLGYPEPVEIRPKIRKEIGLIRNYNRYK
jgi:hypothetical protein